jgi:hypothetical protein
MATYKTATVLRRGVLTIRAISKEQHQSFDGVQGDNGDASDCESEHSEFDSR